MSSASQRTNSLHDSGASTCTVHAVTPQSRPSGDAGQVGCFVCNYVLLDALGQSSNTVVTSCHTNLRQSMPCTAVLHSLTTLTVATCTQDGVSFSLYVVAIVDLDKFAGC